MKKTKTKTAVVKGKAKGKAKVKTTAGPEVALAQVVDLRPALVAKQIKGFAYMKLTNPARLKKISIKAGARAQKLYGGKIRWSKAEAKKMATRGGLARWGRLKEKTA